MAQGRGNFDDTNNATTASATTEASSPVPETTTEDIFAELEVIIGSLSRLLLPKLTHVFRVTTVSSANLQSVK